MSKAKCPAGCGKMFITSAHAVSHADLVHPNWIEDSKKRKGWVTPYGFGDWTHPISYEEACEQMKKFSEEMAEKFKEKKNV